MNEVSTVEAARLLGVTRQRVHQLPIPHRLDERGHRRYRMDDLDRHAARRDARGGR